MPSLESPTSATSTVPLPATDELTSYSSQRLAGSEPASATAARVTDGLVSQVTVLSFQAEVTARTSGLLEDCQ